MKKILLLFSLIILGGLSQKLIAQKEVITSTEELVNTILNSPKSDIKSYTFIQNTLRYDTLGQVKDTSIWYEAVQYPDKFRIDFGSLEKGNTALFKRDSCYRFRSFELDTIYYSPQTFLFFESGFEGYEKIEEIINRIEVLGYDTDQFYHLEDKGVYVIGGDPNDLTQKQIWLDETHFYMVRSVIILGDGRVFDLTYEDFKQIDNFWIETKVVVYLKDRLFQIEEYTEIDIRPDIPKNFFEKSKAFDAHWYNED